MRETILKYLGYSRLEVDNKVNDIIDDCIKEVKQISSFKYIYQEYTNLLPFINENKIYQDYLSGCTSYFLCATTLGVMVDQRIKYYQKTDLTKSIIFDATASAYIEYLADEEENSLKLDLSYRFCPGYNNTSISDNKIILNLLDASKRIGLTINSNNLMIPLKSMCGIIAIGNNKKKTCKDCILNKECVYLKRGLKCYQD